MRSRVLLSLAVGVSACAPSAGPAGAPSAADSVTATLRPRLPTGVRLDPAGDQHDLGSMPLGLAVAPGGRRLAVLLSGYREQGVQIVDRASGRVLQTLVQPSAFLGIAFSPDGRSLWTSGGNQDVVYRYAWEGDSARLADSVVLAPKAPKRSGTRYPAGLAFSGDGATLYVAENLGDAVAAVDVATGRVTGRVSTERYPYAVVVDGRGTAYASAWGGSTVSAIVRDSGGALRERGRIAVVRHPSALALTPDGTRLLVASGSTDQIGVVDLAAGRQTARLSDAPVASGVAGPVPSEGSTPNAFAFGDGGRRLYVAEADANAVAVFDAAADAPGGWRLVGRVPAGWYPSAAASLGDTLFVVNGKGRGTLPNAADGPRPPHGPRRPQGYTLGQTSGTLGIVADLRTLDLAALSARVARANGWGTARTSRAYPPIQHVVYIIKENRGYDQLFGDLSQGDGDTSLVFFGRPVTPNHHALAERFGLYDRFFVNAEVSPDGHNWSTGAYATDYLEKTVPSNYSSRGRTYDYEGTNRGKRPPDDDDVAEPGSGYLWTLAQRAKISFRNYGEFVVPGDFDHEGQSEAAYRTDKPFLKEHTNPDYPGFSLAISDQTRADIWLRELATFERSGQMPALEVIRLPNDHTSGGLAGKPTPRAYVADNDLALGRMVEALSRTKFWATTAVFVLEDDAQNGADHVDSHRAPVLVISPYSRGGVHHRFANTTDVLATIEELLGLEAMSQFDYYGRPLRDAFGPTADLRPYTALVPDVSLSELNPAGTRGAIESRKLDLSREDAADERLFNSILWRAVKGDRVPEPAPRRLPALEYKRGE